MNYKKQLEVWRKEREKIAKMYETGMSVYDIAEKLNVRHSAVARRLKSYYKESGLNPTN